jgi:multidrug efflux pump subunit AcrA (membrane-fusion protein)
MPRHFVARFALPIAAAGMFCFALVSVLTHPERIQAEPALAPPATPFAATVAGVGVIEPRGEEIAIGTNLPGVVSAVHVEAGDAVRIGTPLFTVDDRAARAELALGEAQVRSAEVALADARDQFERARSSLARQATSDAEATRKRFAVELAQARLAEARARVRSIATEIERLTVTSPIDGRVWRVNVRAGEFAPAGALLEPLLVLGDDSALHVRVEIDQTDAHRVRPDAVAVGSLRGDGANPVPLAFVRFEPLVRPKRALTGDGTERVDTRVLEVIYALPAGGRETFVGQQMDVFVEAAPLGIEGGGAPGGGSSG